MKKNVIKFGLISGAIIAAFTLSAIAFCYKANNFDGNMYLGFAAQILAMSFMFVAIKNYRDKENGGVISFGKAFQIGLFISLIASSIYVIAWLVDYYVFIPDFMDKFSARSIAKAHASGASAAEISAKVADAATMKKMYANPIFIVLGTYMEILPTGLVVSLVAALVMKKKDGSGATVVAA